MPSYIKLSFMLLVLVLESGCANTPTYVDSDVMTNRLLHIENEKFMSKTSDGEPFYNSLMEYKEWELLYIKYSKYDSGDRSLTEIELKKLLFIGYIAWINSDAAISQSFSSDLVPIFNQNKSTFLSVISDLKFLMSSTCYFLGNYFGFEGKNHENKASFLEENESRLIKVLGEANGEICLKYIR